MKIDCQLRIEHVPFPCIARVDEGGLSKTLSPPEKKDCAGARMPDIVMASLQSQSQDLCVCGTVLQYESAMPLVEKSGLLVG